MNYILSFLENTWELLAEMSPYLLFGFLIAGALRVLIPKEKIYTHLSKNNMLSVVKASLFGVPLPLCSCGVIPVAAHLRNEGAGKGPTVAFLVSTPTTGVDSMLATYSLLGPLFAVMRPVCALFAGLVAGGLVNLSEGEKEGQISDSCVLSSKTALRTHTFFDKVREVLRYAFHDLLKDTGKSLAIGIAIGGVIAAFAPEALIERYLSNPALSYPLMFLIGIPMYVCATGSIPIAASLILKGMSPGAGLVFLIAGPATNTATMTFIAGKLGKKAFVIYLGTFVLTGLLFGFIMDAIWVHSGKDISLMTGSMKMMPYWIKASAAITLVALVVVAAMSKTQKELTGMGLILTIPDMTCDHCARTIDAALREILDVEDVRIDVKKKQAEIVGDVSKDAIICAIKEAGYTVGEE